jgi:hypothetical protein
MIVFAFFVRLSFAATFPRSGPTSSIASMMRFAAT